VVNKEAFVPLI